jgi:hypothetical protein
MSNAIWLDMLAVRLVHAAAAPQRMQLASP